MKRGPRPKFLQVAAWHEIGTDKWTRNYPWCRFYLVDSKESILKRREYVELTKGQQRDYWHLVMLAGRFNNMIPDDPEQVMFLLHEKEPLDTEALVTAGLVCRRAAGRANARGIPDAGLGKGRVVKDQGNHQEEGQIAEPQKDAAPPRPAGPLFSIPLSDRPNQPFEVTDDLMAVYSRRFPGVEVREQIKKFAERVGSDPDRRPALSGLDASLTGWLTTAAKFRRAS